MTAAPETCCIVEVADEPVAVLMNIGVCVVFTATHPVAMPCNGMRFTSMLEGRRTVSRHVAPVKDTSSVPHEAA